MFASLDPKLISNASEGDIIGVNIQDTVQQTLNLEKLLTVSFTGASTVNSEFERLGVPTDFELNQNYPNPFNPSSTINFGIPEASDVRIDVFNMLGQHISTLVDGKMQAGYHSVIFEASSLSSGIYIYRIVAGDFVQTKRMMLIK